ncbi:MAG: Na+/H+ antiporter NhaC family protein [Lachnospiraceae bacterium]|nr:Na+/H+ antiporter NhaC family protein [Lachnospiraceae bacterium]
MGVDMIEAGWLSILPPLIAIVLALKTKEVYSSLFFGVLSGMLIYCFKTGSTILEAVRLVLDMIAYKIGDNGYMILYLSLLGSVVVIVTMAGGSRAYGQWASTKLKSKRSAKIATALLGCVIFIDDYFNCLTVGTVMRPITDKHKVAREKLAYIIDSTAAPVCIIAPISSWAVAVASEVGGEGGLGAFMQTIPYNLYALLTLLMVALICVTDFDFGKMKKAMIEAEMQEYDEEEEQKEMDGIKISDKGRVYDLLIPIVVLIACSILGMAYVGGFFSGVDFTTAIGENPTAGLTLGALAALLTALVLYIPRKLVTFRDFMGGITAGVKLMVSAVMILALAWSLSGVCREMIGTGEFVSGLVNVVNDFFIEKQIFGGANIFMSLIPALIFIVASFLSFSMGTAWGTFGILIPIVTMICAGTEGAEILIPALGATLAGSVYGDHCSPISDTTILSSAGAKCEHIRHVETQIPYATTVAAVCFVGYLIAGFVRNPWITLGSSIVMLLAVLGIIMYKQKK